MPSYLARSSFYDRRVCSQCVDLPPEAFVLRLDRVDFAFELFEILVCFYEAQDATLAEKGVDYRRRDDKKGSKPQGLLLDFRFLEAFPPVGGRGPYCSEELSACRCPYIIVAVATKPRNLSAPSGGEQGRREQTMSDHILAVTTVGDEPTAVRLAHALLERRLVACVNVVGENP